MPILRTSTADRLREVREADVLRRILRGVRAEAGGGVPEMPHQAGPAETAVCEVQKRPTRLREARLKASNEHIRP